jgi:hypothetical protein
VTVTTNARGAVRRLGRLITWPWRRAVRVVDRWRHSVYGFRRPAWWPEHLSAAWGPDHPHDNRSVVIFVGADRFEFLPAVSDGYRGHAYHGTLRPSASDIAACLARSHLPADAARVLAVISTFEGGFDAIQTYDRGKFAWGFIQFTATGGLPRLLHNLKASVPDVFAEYFGAAGIDVDSGQIVIRVKGRTLRGRHAHNRLHDDPTLWRRFLVASRVDPVQDAQVRTAYENYYARPLEQLVTVGGRRVPLGGLFASNEHARAVVCDRAVNRGAGYALRLFRQAVIRAAAKGAGDTPAILAEVRALEKRDQWRLEALVREIPEPPRS